MADRKVENRTGVVRCFGCGGIVLQQTTLRLKARKNGAEYCRCKDGGRRKAKAKSNTSAKRAK